MSYFIFGDPKVTDLGTKYEISNINVRLLKRDILKIFSTSRISNNLFADIRMNRFTIHKFFALELRRVLSVLSERNNIRTNVRALRILLEAIEKHTWVANLDRAEEFSGRLNFNLLRLMKHKPDDYQSKFFTRYDQYVTALGLNGASLNSAPGTGKSYMAMALATMLESDYVIVVAPLNAVNRVWRLEIEKHFHRPPTAYFSPDSEPYAGQQYSVWHYESLKHLAAIASRFKGKKVTIILDESHYLNEEGRVRTELFKAICRETQSKDILWQSGTSIKALAREALPLISTIDPMFTAAVEERYRKVIAGNTGFANMIVAERLDIMMTTITKDVLTDVNPPEFIQLPVKVENPEYFLLETIVEDVRRYVRRQAEIYTSGFSEFESDWRRMVELARERQGADAKIDWAGYYGTVSVISEAEKRRNLRSVSEQIKKANAFERAYILPMLHGDDKKLFNHTKTIVKYVSLKILGEALGNVVGRRRIEAVMAIAKSVDYKAIYESTSMKTVVFSQYTAAVEEAERQCAEIGLKPITVYGPNAKELDQRVHTFMSNEDVDPMIATFDMLSTAVPLTVADTMVLLNVPFRDYVFQQAVSRISRRNGSKDTRVYICTLDTGTDKNITTRGVDILKWSQEQTEEILGIKSPYEITLDEDGAASEIESTLSVSLESNEYQSLGLTDRFTSPVIGVGVNSWML